MRRFWGLSGLCSILFVLVCRLATPAWAELPLSIAEQEELPVSEEYTVRRIFGVQSGLLPPQFRFLYAPGQPFLYQLGASIEPFWQPHPLMTAEWGTSFHFNISPVDRLQNGDRYWGDWSVYAGIRSFVLQQGIAVPYFTGRAGMALGWNETGTGGIRADWMLEHQVGFGVEFRTGKRAGIPLFHVEASFLGQLPLYADSGNPYTSQPRFGFQIAIKIPTAIALPIAAFLSQGIASRK